MEKLVRKSMKVIAAGIEKTKARHGFKKHCKNNSFRIIHNQ